MLCNVLECTAAHCNTLHHNASHCNTLQYLSFRVTSHVPYHTEAIHRVFQGIHGGDTDNISSDYTLHKWDSSIRMHFMYESTYESWGFF